MQTTGAGCMRTCCGRVRPRLIGQRPCLGCGGCGGYGRLLHRSAPAEAVDGHIAHRGNARLVGRLHKYATYGNQCSCFPA